ncbi:MAG: 6-bladed beta-propeller [Tannerella sp.]|jgi:hypothetical protein|nr:6-bladed beta-propeller [Tannerella sp.]
MKIKNLILLTPFFLTGSQVTSSQSKTDDLPIIDISKEYQKKELRLQDIAAIEYIPLETTDDVLLSDKATLSYVSDSYILVHELIRGDIFVFNRNGKIHSHFNHKGASGQEYTWIGAGTMLDEKEEEIFVCSHTIHIYSLSGEYRRTLNIKLNHYETKVFNFDDETLLIYDDVHVEQPGMKSNPPKTNPYRLVSKKDGSTVSVLDIHLPERYSTRFAEKVGNDWRPTFIYYPHSMYYGQDFVIADISSDTLYLLTQNRELIPLLIRRPSVHASSDPRTVWTTLLTTNKFTLMGTIPIAFNRRGGRIPIFMYEFETGEISKPSILDTEFDMDKWSPPGNPPAMTTKNRTAELIQAPSIVEAYRKNQLKGNAEKFAATLDENDNPVVRIIKFK